MRRWDRALAAGAQSRSDQLNHELAKEIDQRRCAEDQLREAQVELENRVAQRSLELDAAEPGPEQE